MRIRWRTVVTIGVCAVVGAGAVVAMANGSRGGGESASMGRVPAPAGAEKSAPAAAGAPVPAGGVRDASGGTSGLATTGLGGLPTPELRAHVVRRATLVLEVGRKQGEATVRNVIDAVDLAGGFVESTDQSGGRSRLTVRVPSDQFAAILDRLKGLGREHGLEVHGQDVTGAVTDVEARLRNLRAQEAILLELMGKAVSIGDSIAVQQQLSQNQEQIEQLEGQRRVLDDQTTYATLVVAITPKGVPASGADSSPTLSQAWNDGVEAALAVAGGVLVVLGALLPIAVLAGVAALVWRVVLRLRRPRRSGEPAPAAG